MTWLLTPTFYKQAFGFGSCHKSLTAPHNRVACVQLEMVPLLDIAQPAVTAGAAAATSHAAAKTATATATTSTDGSPANGGASSKGAGTRGFQPMNGCSACSSDASNL